MQKIKKIFSFFLLFLLVWFVFPHRAGSMMLAGDVGGIPSPPPKDIYNLWGWIEPLPSSIVGLIFYIAKNVILVFGSISFLLILFSSLALLGYKLFPFKNLKKAEKDKALVSRRKLLKNSIEITLGLIILYFILNYLDKIIFDFSYL